MFKRIRPRARGMAFMILRRMAHIKITLDDPHREEEEVDNGTEK